MATPGATVVVPVKSAWLSKINWTQALAAGASLLTAFGLPSLSPAEQASILLVINLVSGGLTGVFKTFFTTTVTPSSSK